MFLRRALRASLPGSRIDNCLWRCLSDHIAPLKRSQLSIMKQLHKNNICLNPLGPPGRCAQSAGIPGVPCCQVVGYEHDQIAHPAQAWSSETRAGDFVTTDPKTTVSGQGEYSYSGSKCLRVDNFIIIGGPSCGGQPRSRALSREKGTSCNFRIYPPKLLLISSNETRRIQAG